MQEVKGEVDLDLALRDDELFYDPLVGEEDEFADFNLADLEVLTTYGRVTLRKVLRELMNELERAGLEYRLKAEAGEIG